MTEELDDNQECELDTTDEEFEVADLPADDNDSILNLLPQPRRPFPLGSNYGADGQRWRLEDAARSMSMAREQIRLEAQEELEEELELPPNWRERDQKRNLERWHQRMALRAKASGRPRCQHVYVDGTRCRLPRLDAGRLCHAHEQMERVCPRPNKPNAGRKLNLLPMEDGNSIMLNIMAISRALLEEEITEQRARILLSSQQMGLRALKHVTFKLTAPELMVREMADRMSVEQKPTGSGDRVMSEEEEFVTDERRRAQMAEECLTANDAESAKEEEYGCVAEDAEEEEFAADERRRAQIAEECLTANDAESAKEEYACVAENAEGAEEQECDSIPDLKVGSTGKRFSPARAAEESAIRGRPAV